MSSRCVGPFSLSCLAGLLLALSPGGALGQWSEDFDDYVTGGTLLEQGSAWESWDNAAGIDADVVDEVAFSEPNSLRLQATSDMVMQFSDVVGGSWVVSAMTFIADTHVGETWFILMDQYTVGGDPKHWATQISIGNGQVTSAGGSDFGGGGALPWITEEWVELRVEIYLEENLQVITYGGQLLDETPWQLNGLPQLAAIDLWSNGGLDGYGSSE